jgi:hypothetical protein
MKSLQLSADDLHRWPMNESTRSGDAADGRARERNLARRPAKRGRVTAYTRSISRP